MRLATRPDFEELRDMILSLEYTQKIEMCRKLLAVTNDNLYRMQNEMEKMGRSEMAKCLGEARHSINEVTNGLRNEMQVISSDDLYVIE